MGDKILGQRIEQRRKQLGLTLDDIAKEIGVAKSTIQRYEKGTIGTIKLPVIEAIARIMDVDPAWICGKTDIMNGEKKPSGCPLCNPEAHFDGAIELFETETEDGKYRAVFRVNEEKMTASELSALLSLLENISNQSGVSIEGLSALADAAAKAMQRTATKHQAEENTGRSAGDETPPVE